MDWAVILAGGSGTRFWPLSTPRRPKQLLPLTGATLDRGGGGRATGAASSARADPGRRRRAASRRLAARPLEPAPGQHARRAPRRLDCACARVGHLRRARAAIRPRRCSRCTPTGGPGPGGFRRTADPRSRPRGLRRPGHGRPGTDAARDAAMATSCPASRSRSGSHRIARFVEKPPRRQVADADGGGRPLEQRALRLDRRAPVDELQAHAPEVARAMLDRLAEGNVAAFFEGITVSHRRRRLRAEPAVAVVRGAFRWDDVGTWDALGRIATATARQRGGGHRLALDASDASPGAMASPSSAATCTTSSWCAPTGASW